jgi:hypothetical protein
MGTNQQYIEELAGYHQRVAELVEIIPSEIGYKVKSIAVSYQDMFDRFCPFQIGEKVILSKAIDFTKAPSWESSRHFLIEGAIAIIKERDFRNKLFVFGVEFEEDSWIDTEGDIHQYKPEDRHLFCISELNLIKMISSN